MKKLFKKISDWFKRILLVALPKYKQISKIAVDITNKLKAIVESEVLDIAVNLIPGDVDNVILDKIRNILPLVIKNVSLAAGIAFESENNSEVIQKLIDHLKSLNPEGRKAFWVAFAGELNRALADGKISFEEAVILSQIAYKELKK